MRIIIIVTTCLIQLLFTSCGYDYDTKVLKVHSGEIIPTNHNGNYRLGKVSSSSITLHHVDMKKREGWKLATRGRWGKGEPHSLGNNESLQILSVDPTNQTVKIQLMWLTSVGVLTMPPF